jgi:hypothetical protein
MFDEGTKISLFIVGAVALVLTLAADRYGPREDLATAIETSRLPPSPAAPAPDGAPAQTDVTPMRLDLGGGFEAQLMHGYLIEGRVVTRREFRNDATSAVSPLDLGIVWGDLAAPGRTDGFEFRTGRRTIWYRPGPDDVLPAGWEEQVTNNHLIPANQAVNEALLAVEIGARVRLHGYLVVVTGERTAPWRSSTRRDDNTIIGGCEIVLVTKVEILPEDGEAA